jgi:lipoic acid synthetase
MSSSAPEWLIAEVRQAKRGHSAEKEIYTRNLLSNLKLSTVCESALCPNRNECFSHYTATFLILGDVCTRHCAFCAVKRDQPLKSPDRDEPERLAQAVTGLGLRHVVITSVTRDDLPDGGANHYVQVVRTLRDRCPGVKVELLVPDFSGSDEALATLLEEARSEILAHNLETVPRLYPQVRQGADYHRSCALLKKVKDISPQLITKSGLMLGLGEEDWEVEEVLWDLRGADCDMLTLGQYLAPSLAHAPVAGYVTPEKFAGWRQKALDMGFRSVAAAPLVRSSYQAYTFFEELR